MLGFAALNDLEEQITSNALIGEDNLPGTLSKLETAKKLQEQRDIKVSKLRYQGSDGEVVLALEKYHKALDMWAKSQSCLYKMKNETESVKLSTKEAEDVHIDNIGADVESPKYMLASILEEMEPIFHNVDNMEQRFVGDIQKSPIHLLLYLTYKNLGIIMQKEDDLPSTLSYYLKAFSIDNSDVAFACEIGDLAMKRNMFSCAKQIYHQGMSSVYEKHVPTPANSIPSSIPPQQVFAARKCLHGLIEALYELGEFAVCLKYLNIALKETPKNVRCLWIKYDIIRNLIGCDTISQVYEVELSPRDIMDFKLNNARLFEKLPSIKPELCRPRACIDNGPVSFDAKPVVMPLKDRSWVGLGKAALKLIEKLKKFDDVATDGSCQDLTCFMSPVCIELDDAMCDASSTISSNGVDETPHKDEIIIEKTEETQEENVMEKDMNTPPESPLRKRTRQTVAEELKQLSIGDIENENPGLEVERVEEDKENEPDHDDERLAKRHRAVRIQSEFPSTYNDSALCSSVEYNLPSSYRLTDLASSCEKDSTSPNRSVDGNTADSESFSSHNEVALAPPLKCGVIIKNLDEYLLNIWYILDWLPKQKGRRGRRSKAPRQPTARRGLKRLASFEFPKSDGSAFEESVIPESILDRFIDKLQKSSANILDLFRSYLEAILIPCGFNNFCVAWSFDEIGEIIIKIVQKLEVYNAGTAHWRNQLTQLSYSTPDFKNMINLLLTICEILHHSCQLQVEMNNTNGMGSASNAAALNDVEMRVDTEDSSTSTLVSSSIWKILWRLWSCLAENQHKFLVKPDRDSDQGDVRLSLRYFWLSAQMEQKMMRLKTASEMYEKCKLYCQVLNNPLVSASPFESSISFDVIDYRICMLEARHFIVDVDTLFKRGDKSTTWAQLAPVFLPTLTSLDDPSLVKKFSIAQDFVYVECDLDRRLVLMGYLYESCPSDFERWTCTVVRFMDIVRNLTCDMDPIELFENLEETISQLLRKLNEPSSCNHMNLLRQYDGISKFAVKSKSNSRKVSLYDQFLSSVFVLQKVVFAILLKMDLNDLETFNDTLKIVAFRGILLFYEYLRVSNLWDDPNENKSVCNLDMGAPVEATIDETQNLDIGDTNDETKSGVDTEKEKAPASNLASTSSSSTVDWLSECLIIFHDILGKRNICHLDDGRFLKIAKRRLSEQVDVHYHRHLYQCYFCMYGIYIKVDPEVRIENHHAAHEHFGEIPAKELFNNVASYILQVLNERSYRLISNEVKTCLEKITDVFKDSPWDYGPALRNKELISNYLESDVNVLEAAPDAGLALQLATFSRKDLQKVQDIYFRIYHIYGKVAWGQYKSKSTVLKSKKLDVSLNPTDFDSWLSLGSCHAASANEILAWSALEIRLRFAEIRDHQVKAFHCFSQATQCYRLQRSINYRVDRCKFTKVDIASELFAEFGYLCHSMATRPLSGSPGCSRSRLTKRVWYLRAEALKKNVALANIDLSELTESKAELFQSSIQLMHIGVWAFKRAMQLDPQNWQYPFMIGKLMEKLKKPPKLIVEYYGRSILLIPKEWGTKEQERIMDPHYKLLSFVVKLLQEKSIQPSEVEPILDKYLPAYWEYPDWKNIAVEDIDSGATGDEKSSAANGGLVEDEILNSDSKDPQDLDQLKAYKLVLRAFQLMRVLDKKRWQHRIVYKVAWIYHHVMKDVKRASSEIQSLFNLKPTAKTFTSFWKPEFERPGKYFIYIEKYTKLMIETMSQLNDAENLRVVCKKIRKSDDLYFNPSELWPSAYRGLFKALSLVRGPIGCTQLCGRLSKEEFDNKAPEVESLMFNYNPADKELQDEENSDNITDPSKNPIIVQQTLLRAFELKKLNEGSQDDEELDLLLLDLYSSLFMEFGGYLNTQHLESQTQGLPGNISVPGLITSDQTKEPLLFVHVLKRVIQVCRNPPIQKGRMSLGGLLSGKALLAPEPPTIQDDNSRSGTRRDRNRDSVAESEEAVRLDSMEMDHENEEPVPEEKESNIIDNEVERNAEKESIIQVINQGMLCDSDIMENADNEELSQQSDTSVQFDVDRIFTKL